MKINLNVFEIILITNLTEKGPKSINAFVGIALTKENDPGRLKAGRSDFQKPVEENQSTIKSARLGKFSFSAEGITLQMVVTLYGSVRSGKLLTHLSPPRRTL